MPPHPRDNRVHPRYACSLPCALLTGDGEYEAVVANVSVGGLYLLSLARLERGSRLRVRIEGLETGPLELPVEVVHWRELEAGAGGPQRGYGVRIEKVSAGYLGLVSQLADAVPAAG